MPAPIKSSLNLFKLPVKLNHSTPLKFNGLTPNVLTLNGLTHNVLIPNALVQATYMAVALILPSTLLPVAAVAAPTVIVNNASESTTTSNNATPDAPADPQVAPQPASPFNEDPNQTATNSDSTTPNALTNPNSLASSMQPSDSDLSAANQELLSRNAKLQRDVNDLETRVNVLINERSGQLFMYGAVTVGASLLVGFLLGGFVFSRRERW